MRIVAWVLGGLLVLVVGGIGILAATFDANVYKPRIVDAVKQATGRDIQLRGHIGFALALHPTIEVKDVVFSNPPGLSRPDMATVEKLDLQLGLLPLLSKRIEIDRLIVTKPNIQLETDAKGQGNWVFAPPAQPAQPTAPAAPGAGGKSTPMTVAIKDVRLVDGLFTYRDGVTGQTSTLAVKDIATKAASPDAPLHVTAAFNFDGTDYTVTGDTGALSVLTDPSGGAPWPVKMTVAAAGAKIGIDGTIANPATAQGLDLGISVDVPDLTTLAPVAKQALPPLKAIVFSARLTGNLQAVALKDVKLTSSAGDLTGDLSVTLGPTTTLTGTLKSDKFDADQVMPPAGAKAPADKAAPAAAAAPAVKSKFLVSDQPLTVAPPSANADVRIVVGVLHFGGSDYKAIDAHAVLRGGVLTLDPAVADLPQGHLGMTLTADDSKPDRPLHWTMHTPGIALQPLLQQLGEPPYVSGNLEVEADLRGAGASPHDIAASLDGYIGLAMPGGSIDIKRLGGAAARVLETLNPATSAGGASALRCFALRIDFVKGVGTVKAFALGSALVNVDGTGTVNMVDETLSLNLRSRALVAGAAVTVPLRVFGSLAAPQHKVDEIGIAQSNAAALGGFLGGSVESALGVNKQPAGGGDVCPGALAAARGQAASAASTPAASAAAAPASAPTPAPAPAPAAKPPNAGQLLKQLFH